MEESQDHDFSEFEGVERQYSRRMLPWFIWGIVILLLAFDTARLFTSLYDVFFGRNFDYTLFGLGTVVFSPLSDIVSIVTLMFFWITPVALWKRTKHAAIFGQVFAITGLVICVAVFILSYLKWGTVLGAVRIETIFFLDFYFRVSDLKKSELELM
jgi:hypothetical protein